MNEPDSVSSESLIHLADVNANSSANKEQNKLTLVHLETWERGGGGGGGGLGSAEPWCCLVCSDAAKDRSFSQGSGVGGGGVASEPSPRQSGLSSIWWLPHSHTPLCEDGDGSRSIVEHHSASQIAAALLPPPPHLLHTHFQLLDIPAPQRCPSEIIHSHAGVGGDM